MEKRYNFFDFATHTMVVFAISVIILNIFSLIFGNDAESYSAIFVLGNRGISAEIVFQFLALAALITGTRFTFFTYTFFKRMTISLRTICMVTAVIVEIALFSIFFNWFPANSWKPWLCFLICFGVCFVVSFLVMILKEKIENRKLDEALKRLQAMENNEHDLYY